MVDEIVGTVPGEASPALPDPAGSKQAYVLLFSCLLLGALGDLLFYGKALGVSYPLFTAAFYVVFFLHLGSGGGRRLCFGRLLAVPVFALAATFALHTNLPLMVLNFLMIPLLLVAQTVLAAGANRFQWYDFRFILDILEGLFGRTVLHVSVPFRMVQKGFKQRTDQRRYDMVKRVATGLAVSLPLLLVVVLLLSNADAVFSHYLGRVPELLGRVKLGEVLLRTMLALLAAVISFAYIYSFRFKGRVGEAAVRPPAEPLQRKRPWDPLTVSTFLVMLNLVYVLFTVIQFSYLFGGGHLALPEGFTYAEYARQGFFELLAVTMINLSIFIFVINFTGDARRVFYSAVRFLLTLLSASTLVMLVSAFSRLFLYEEAYGFTYARVAAHAFMIYLFVLFLAAIYRIWQERASLLKAFIVVTLAACLAFNYFGIDRFIAANNIDRYLRSGKIDVFYLISLSDDAVPQLTRLLDTEDSEVVFYVEDNLYYRKQRLSRQSWQSFNWSRWRARLSLENYDLKPHYFESETNRGW
jgi:hypothetical protein